MVVIFVILVIVVIVVIFLFQIYIRLWAATRMVEPS